MFTVYDTDKEEFSLVEEPDPSLSYTYADYLKWQFEERLELIKGRIFRMSPAPNTRHQQIAGDLFVAIKNLLFKQQCRAFIAPFDVRLPVKNRKKDNEVTTVVQPDICIICDPLKIDARGVCGAPELIVEVLSPDNSNKEVKLKFELYQEAGVKEYWIVYPEEESVAVFVLNEANKYNGAVLYAGDDRIRSSAIPGLTIHLTDIFTT